MRGMSIISALFVLDVIDQNGLQTASNNFTAPTANSHITLQCVDNVHHGFRSPGVTQINKTVTFLGKSKQLVYI